MLNHSSVSTVALVDCGATASFIDADFVRRQSIGLQPRVSPLHINIADGRPISSGAITHETIPVRLVIGPHSEDISLNVTTLDRYPIFLGVPWLSLHDPTIRWSQHQIIFDSDFCRAHCLEPLHVASRDGPSPIERSSVDSSPLQLVAPAFPVLAALSVHPPAASLGVDAAASPGPLAVSSGRPSAASPGHLPAAPSGLLHTAASPASDSSLGIPPEYADFADVFSKDSASVLPPHRPYDHQIPLLPGTSPPFGPLYPLSEVELKALDEYIRENLAKGYIQPSTSPAGAPILFQAKRDGTLRLCVDYRGLNKITIKNRYPLPLIRESLDRLRSATIFSKLDLRSGYNLVRIAPGDEWKTAFRSRYGHYEYRVMPFGLTNAPATFQNLMNDVLRDFLDSFAVVYLDDILIYSRSIDDHQRHVRLVLERLRANGLFAKPEKCAFHQDEIEYLGYLVSVSGVKMDSRKVATILDWPEPSCVRDIQMFLGFANFYRRFIMGFSKIATPLTRLLQKNRVFAFDDAARHAFDQLKTAFTTAPVLAHFHPDRPSILETDASDFAIAAVFSQHDAANVLHPVAFYSRKLSAAELNYDIHDKEMLAIVEAIREWRAYLEGAAHPFVVYTDHKNLEHFATTKVLNRRQSRWSEFLASYNFKIVYRPGAAMTKADAMSRRHDFSEGSKASDAPPRTLLKPGQLQLFASRSSDDSDVPSILDDIRASQPSDPALQRVLPFLRDPLHPRDNSMRDELSSFSLRDGLVYFDGRVYVPDDDAIKLKILRQCHDAPSAGHFGQARTREMVTRDFYWPTLRRFVDRYVASCDTCCRAKMPRHKPFGLLEPLPVPLGPWSSLSMDLVVALPPSPSGHDAIFVVVDRFTKMAHFSPTMTTADAPDIARLFLRDIYRLHGLPADIVSDRDRLFTSKFWRHFLALLDVQPNMSTAFHPQTDGQTERVNQVLEQYLRMFCNYQQDDWQDLLPLAEFAYNNSVHASTHQTPFFASYGYHPSSVSTVVPRAAKSTNPAADSLLKSLCDIQAQLARDLADASATQARFYDKKVKCAPDWKEGDQVWLLRRNIKTARPCNKLDHKRLGPFTIEKKIGKAAYRLKLPPTMRIHPVFHVSLLEPVRPNDIPGRIQDPSPPIIIDDYEEYEVEEVLDSRFRRRKLQYYVHWRGYPVSARTWEPCENLANAQDLVDEFHRAYPSKPHPRRV